MSGTTTILDEIKSWANSIVGAIAAAAQIYEQQPGTPNQSLVASLVTAMQSANQALQQVTDENDAKGIIMQILEFVGRVEPAVAQFLPAPVAIGVPIAVAMLEALVQGLPISMHPAAEQAKKAMDAHAAAFA